MPSRYPRRYVPLLLAIIILWIMIATLLHRSSLLNDGHFIYALDDPYIHLAMAKNVNEHGVWGITRYGFSSSTSSPLWTLLLVASQAILGDLVAMPFILNCIFATLALVLIDRIVKSHAQNAGPVARFCILLSVIFFTPFSALIFGGLEHTMHLFFTLWFVHHAVRIISGKYVGTAARDMIATLLLGALLCSSRYEGFFLVGIVFVLLFFQKRWNIASAIGFTAAAPAVIYGILSVAHGWYILPNSVMLKGQFPDFASINSIALLLGARLFITPHLLVLVIAACLVFWANHLQGKSIWEPEQLLLLVTVAAIILHVQFAKVGWLLRYEAYLVPLGIVALVAGFYSGFDSFKKTPATQQIPYRIVYSRAGRTILLLAGLACFFPRVRDGIVLIPKATNDIYRQQFHMATFLKKYYTGAAVAANDVGAINYFADIKCLDLFGIGTMETARLRREDRYGKSAIDSMAAANGVQLAMVFDNWYHEPPGGVYSRGMDAGLPSRWQKVGWWIFTNTVIVGDTVSIYAVATSAKDSLIEHLKDFSPELTPDVKQGGEYRHQ